MRPDKWERLKETIAKGGDYVGQEVAAGRIKIRKNSRSSKARKAKNSERSSRSMALLRRRELVADLRIQGLSYMEIARTLRKAYPHIVSDSYSREGVKADLGAYLEHAHQSTVEEVKQLRSVELLRMDWLTTKLTQMIIDPNKSAGIHRSIELYLKVSERRAKLAGLDSPVQVDTRMFGDIQLVFGIDDSAYKEAEENPDLFIDGEYEIQNQKSLVPTGGE